MGFGRNINGLKTNENTLSDTDSEISILLDLQLQCTICTVISIAFIFRILCRKHKGSLLRIVFEPVRRASGKIIHKQR